MRRPCEGPVVIGAQHHRSLTTCLDRDRREAVGEEPRGHRRVEWAARLLAVSSASSPQTGAGQAASGGACHRVLCSRLGVGEGRRLIGQAVNGKVRRAEGLASASPGGSSNHGHHVLDLACLTEGRRRRGAPSRSYPRNGLRNFLPLAAPPPFRARQESRFRPPSTLFRPLQGAGRSPRPVDSHRGRDGRDRQTHGDDKMPPSEPSPNANGFAGTRSRPSTSTSRRASSGSSTPPTRVRSSASSRARSNSARPGRRPPRTPSATTSR